MNNYIIYEELGRGRNSVVHKVNSKGKTKKDDRILYPQKF